MECGGNDVERITCDHSGTAIGLTRARTTAFICVVWCENLRAYVARSFQRPVWEGVLSNPAMQNAIFMAQVALYIVILTPKLSTEIMALDGQGLPGEGWALGIGGSFGCLVLCELYKPLVRRQSEEYQRKVLLAQGVAPEPGVYEKVARLEAQVSDLMSKIMSLSAGPAKSSEQGSSRGADMIFEWDPGRRMSERSKGQAEEP